MPISELLSGGGKFMRCGIYVRVSTDDQRDNGYAIDSHMKFCKIIISDLFIK